MAAVRWEFGDGEGSDQFEPAHTYPAPGVYRATFSATGTDGWVDQASVKVTVLPDSGEALPGPSLELTEPGRDHQDLRGTVELAVAASDDVVRVEYYLGPRLLRAARDAPFGWRWETGSEPNGMYYLTAVAYARAGRIDLSQRMVSIAN